MTRPVLNAGGSHHVGPAIGPQKCIHFGEPTGNKVLCPSCRGKVELKTFACAVHGQCLPTKQAQGVACCIGCKEYSPEKKTMKWAYGVTTVPERRDDLLPRTLASLVAGGFDNPMLFVDGDTAGNDWYSLMAWKEFRYPRINAYGNWLLALLELYIRGPHADRYAIFQDDIVCCRNLRAYLEAGEMPGKSYWNLFTSPDNQELAKGKGWFPSNQRGRGALALVFSREGVVTLLTSQHMMMKPQDQRAGHCNIDGAVSDAMRKAGWVERCHNPSLVQHMGVETTIGPPHGTHVKPTASSFPGENYDLMELLACH